MGVQTMDTKPLSEICIKSRNIAKDAQHDLADENIGCFVVKSRSNPLPYFEEVRNRIAIVGVNIGYPNERMSVCNNANYGLINFNALEK